jgi:hypothetical protein
MMRTMGTAIAAAMIATATGFTLASPAQADFNECIAYLEGAGYGINGQRRDACIDGAGSEAGGWLLCRSGLTATGIPSGVAREACDRAAQ